MKTDAIIILDGYGLNFQTFGNAIKKARTPYLDYLFKTYPHSELSASGLDVGLPAGQMGNSEVGHLNLGAGRIVYQDITMIDREIETGAFFQNSAFVAAMENARKRALHLCGLASDGGVHSTVNHLFALLKMAKSYGVKDVYVHCVADGRDTSPKSAGSYIQRINDECQKLGIGKIATVVGRYWYMDRDNRWDRVEKGYSCVFEGQGAPFAIADEAVQNSYSANITDEFIEPCVICGYKGVSKGDSFIYYNFRADRAREITRAAIEPGFAMFPRKRGFLAPLYVGMTQYDASFTGLYTAYAPKQLSDTLGEYLAKNNKSQLRIAETEKYAHVTFFFNGGVEEPNSGERRILVPSLKVATYDLQPQMSASGIAAEAEKSVGTAEALILNFANCDMVGHTGNFEATVRAVETVDECLKRVAEAVLKTGGTALILSDHGNAECMVLEDGTPVTAHTVSPVPFIVAGERYKGARVKNGLLCDVAPTFLNIMGLPVPRAMTGKNLLE